MTNKVEQETCIEISISPSLEETQEVKSTPEFPEEVLPKENGDCRSLFDGKESCSVDARFFTPRHKLYGRAFVFFLMISVLFLGRFSVPDNEVQGIEDKLFSLLEPITKFLIANPANYPLRDALQIICSALMDISFIVTFGYWLFNGKTGRAPICLGAFYFTRAIIQKIYWSPFPEYYYWGSPGVPSLVVEYGRGSDFFFSGHAGFLVICANEWHKLGVKKVRNFIIGSLIYTVIILLVYRIHYSIDVFAGIIYADWCFGKIDAVRHHIDDFFLDLVAKGRKFLGKNLK